MTIRSAGPPAETKRPPPETKQAVEAGTGRFKRALIVLDNVWGSAEVEPLVPPTGACAVIVTTRRHDLAVTRGARRFGLTPFDRERREALDLFGRMLGPERAQRAASTAVPSPARGGR